MIKIKHKPAHYGVGIFGFSKKPEVNPKYAGFNRRMLAATIDSIVAMIILAPVINLFLGWYSPLPALDWSVVREQITPEMSEEEVNRIAMQYWIASGYARQWFSNLMLQFVCLSVVTGICWRFWGATPGKKLLRMKVVDAKTEELLSDGQVMLRLFGYIPSTLVFCIGFFWIGTDKRRQGWHDKLARSVVIIEPKAKSAAEAADASNSPAP